MAKKTIAVDIDDVLAANAEGFTKFSNKKWGTNLTPDDYSEHWAELWGVDDNERHRRRETIFDHRLFLSYRFFDDAKPSLKQLSKKFKLVVVSSRSRRIQKDTTEWIKKEFGDIFAEIHFAKMWDMEDKTTEEKIKMTKTEVLNEVGADYLIDDQPKHCITAAEAGIKSVLFGYYKWNRDTKLRPNMVRAKNWQEVLEYFDAESRRTV